MVSTMRARVVVFAVGHFRPGLGWTIREVGS